MCWLLWLIHWFFGLLNRHLWATLFYFRSNLRGSFFLRNCFIVFITEKNTYFCGLSSHTKKVFFFFFKYFNRKFFWLFCLIPRLFNSFYYGRRLFNDRFHEISCVRYI